MDLVYGHMGQPVYDTDSKTWHFTRDAHSRRYMHLICPLMNAKESQTIDSFNGDMRHLERSFAGVDQAMLHDLLHFSETVAMATSQHDPTVSDLISFGNAVDELVLPTRFRLRYKPIVAVASGAAGELLRLIVLNRENLGWQDFKGVKLHAMTGRNGVEGWWKGSGGKIQQVTFAGKELKASTIVGIRQQGAISILNPKIQLNPVCPANAHGQILGLPSSRLDASHGVTVTPTDTGGLPFADVAFDPWNYSRFVTVDQAGRWQTWIIKRGPTWTASKDLNGHMNQIDDATEVPPILDGWARASWATNSDTLIVASRTAFMIFDIEAKHVNRSETDLYLSKNSDWILDIKKSPASQSHLLVLTSSRLLLLEIRGAKQRSTKPDAAVILVSWVHFRAHQDVSLSLSVIESTVQKKDLHVENTIMVTVYSRLNGLASVFAFSHSNVTNQASSMFDPCLLPLPNMGSLPQDPRKAREDKYFGTPPLGLNVTTISITHKHGVDPRDAFDQTGFYLLRVLNHDLSFSEYLYAASTVPNFSLNPPNVQRQIKKRKTPAKITDDFIVPDGVVDDPSSDSAPDAKTAHSAYGIDEPRQQDTGLSTGDAPIKQSVARSLDMQWLIEEIKKNHEGSVAPPFDDVLEVIQESIAEKLYTVKSGAETLLEVCIEAPLITDIDEAAASLDTLLASFVHSKSDMKKSEMVSKDPYPIFMSLLPQVSDKWHNGQYIDLLQVYESLVRSEISPLPMNIPGRVRLEREKDLRTVAVQIFLAAHTLSTCVRSLPGDDMNDTNMSIQDPNFFLPVRGKDFAPSLASGAAITATQAPSLSQPSAPVPQSLSSQALPKTPTAGNIDREFVEDPSSVNLRSLVSLAPQPLLPPKLSNILSHWRVGGDPSSYDWESSQRTTIHLDDEGMAGEQVRGERIVRKVKKRARENTVAENPMDRTVAHTQEASSSQPAPKQVLVASSQGAPPVIASSQMLPEGSQAGGQLGVSSQPLPGKFADGKKVKKPRRKGF